MTFPLGTANLLLLHCELWDSRSALLTNTTSTGPHWLGRAQPSAVARQFIRWLLSQNTHTRAHRRTHCLSLLPFLLSFSVILTHKQKNSQIWHSQTTGMQEKRQRLAKGSVPVSSSSPASVFHQRYEGPTRFRSQSGNTFSPKTQNWGSFKDRSPVAPFPLCYCLHLFCLESQLTLAVRTWLLKVSKHKNTHRARALFALCHILRLVH